MRTVDPACYDLARHFLDDDDVTDLTADEAEARIVLLAQAIQDAVEAWNEEDAVPSHRLSE